MLFIVVLGESQKWGQVQNTDLIYSKQKLKGQISK